MQALNDLPSTNTALANPHTTPPLEHCVPEGAQLAAVIVVPQLQSHVVQALFIEALPPRGSPAGSQPANSASASEETFLTVAAPCSDFPSLPDHATGILIAAAPVPVLLQLGRVEEAPVPCVPASVCDAPLVSQELPPPDAIPAVLAVVGHVTHNVATHTSVLQPLTGDVTEIPPHPLLVPLTEGAEVPPDPFTKTLTTSEAGTAHAALQFHGIEPEHPFAQQCVAVASLEPGQRHADEAAVSMVALPVSRPRVSSECASGPNGSFG